VVIEGMLAYAGEKNVGEGSYMVFAFKAEQHTPAIFELLKEDLQSIKVVPGQQVEKTFGLNAFRFSEGKLSMDRGILGMDGSIRFGDGMVLRLEDPSVMLVPNENPLETGELNKMLLGGRIGGTSIVVGEDGIAKAFYGGSYLPATISASSLGLQLGLLAKPSGETLMITQADLAQRGMADPGLLNVFYPNGETSTIIYTGKDLQAPLFSYSSGAFVGIQAVETRIVWTSVDKRTFYEQITSVSELLGNILGKDFKEGLLEAILLNGLTDSQALDVVNTLAKNVEWLKTLSGEKRIELVRKITEYVKKGDTAEEAVEKAKRESEEYVKSIKNEITEFCSSISTYDAQLAKEVLELINCVKKNLGYDAAKWLLDVSKRVYSKALNESKGNREVANAKLRDVVEKAFRYPESTLEGCALASAIVSEMRMKSIEQAWEELNRIANYPDGIKVKGILSKEGGRFRIRLSKTLLASYLGDEACWVKIEVKGKTVYREYKPAYNYFNLPEDIGEDGEEVEITIKKITTYDFIKTAIKGAGAPFNIVFKLGGYWLTMNEQEVCEVSMEEDLYHDRGDHGPAVIFAIRDYWGGEHLIKLVHKESKEYVCKIRIGSISFREIRNVKYEEKRSRLIIEYSQERAMSEATSKHEIFLENPKSVLVRMAEELREIISAKGLPEVNPEAGILTGEVGWYYVRLYREDEIKEIVSKITGILKEELHVFQGYEREGPDFYVYHKSELIAIVEVKTSVTSMDSLQDRIKKEAIPQVKRYLHGEWKDARFGIIVPIYLEDLDRIIETEFREGVLCLISKDNYEKYIVKP
jgi:hypothetical protein